jgi:calcineurin-like phosphoesterase family protein
MYLSQNRKVFNSEKYFTKIQQLSNSLLIILNNYDKMQSCENFYDIFESYENFESISENLERKMFSHNVQNLEKDLISYLKEEPIQIQQNELKNVKLKYNFLFVE